ncbi:hypothetical protein DY000_02019896 [Brassica cretica]|uniref:RING-CH-type domain-containing protein n=1 Tax=Brassica cretica TaxID=69181 RepID=A0ABQ7D9I9_BRACR|nr:hypothetical protein DY000_02019896 [Brassica cretica]
MSLTSKTGTTMQILRKKIQEDRVFTRFLPVTPLAHSNPESMHGSYAVDDHVTSMKRERTLPIRRTRSVPTLIDKDGNVTPVGVLRVIPTPPRVGTESLEMMHEHDNGGEDVPEEEALCRICMVELGQDSEAFNMECMCKGELALAHRECTIKWFTIKGNITCDVCKQDVKNLPLTLLRVKDPQDQSSREAEHTGISEIINEWQVALPFACIIGLLAPVTSTTMATMVGFGLTMSGTVVITVFMEWRRSNSHHQPSSTQVATVSDNRVGDSKWD